jgi:membrane associated rhomboid family serine protease
MGSTPAPSVPTCYRHPDRETYIRCSCCERPICPDCMTSAPVGYQCPECVREGNKSARTARTALGGTIRDRGDLVTKVLIGANVAIWVVVLAAGSRELLEPFALANLVRFEAGAPLVGVQVGEWYRMITAAFLHEQFWHIALNMFALWILGSAIEPVLGRWRFITLYVLSALGGSAVSLLGLPPGGIAIGASGAVFGLFGALFVVARRFGRDVSSVVVILGINAVISFTVPTIDWRAHLGGLITGAALALAYAHAPKAHRTAFGVAASIAVAVVIAVVALVFVA